MTVANIITGYKELEIPEGHSTWIERVTYTRSSKTLTVTIKGTVYAYHGVSLATAEQVFEGVAVEQRLWNGGGYPWSRRSHGKAMHSTVLGAYEYEIVEEPTAA